MTSPGSSRTSAVEHDWLTRWIQPQHVFPAAQRRARRRVSAHPAGLLVVPSFLQARVARRVSAFLMRDARYSRRRGLYSRADFVTARVWNSSAARDRLYRYHVVSSVRPSAADTAGAAGYMKLMHAMQDDRTARLLSSLTGAAPGRLHVAVHAMRPGDFLAPHTDDREDRQIAFILYLTAGWTASRGGALHLTAAGRTWTIVPAFNQLVMFDVTAAEHWVTPVRSGASRPRLTIGGWMTRDPSSSYDGGARTEGR